MEDSENQNQKISKFKKPFLLKYREFVDCIGPEHFENTNDIVPAAVLLKIFKEGLLAQITSYFHVSWDYGNTNDNLQILDLLKTDSRNDTEKKWRPTGKTVEEQVRPLIVNKLKWQIKFYEKQIQFQKQQLESAIKQLEIDRKKYNDMRSQREVYQRCLMTELDDLEKIRSEIMHVDTKLVTDLAASSSSSDTK
ncbi:uncharacterized protein LOC129758167 [Uranotaenia lowii]|uniref:uncharacterized protein LOC129758167 n=1 Tax=Uranotaenia lowii TaxID=190385 RepID=UPI0024786D62|nr:uncharacterized protein LOC129758167 [Uranotaenia lowii]